MSKSRTTIELTASDIKAILEKATGERILEIDYYTQHGLFSEEIETVTLTLDRAKIKEENNKPVNHE